MCKAARPVVESKGNVYERPVFHFHNHLCHLISGLTLHVSGLLSPSLFLLMHGTAAGQVATKVFTIPPNTLRIPEEITLIPYLKEFQPYLQLLSFSDFPLQLSSSTNNCLYH